MMKRPPVPRGAGLFGEAEPERKAIAAHQVNIDGGSRGNPGRRRMEWWSATRAVRLWRA